MQKKKKVRMQLCAGLFSRESHGSDIYWQSYNMQTYNCSTQNNKMMACWCQYLRKLMIFTAALSRTVLHKPFAFVCLFVFL